MTGFDPVSRPAHYCGKGIEPLAYILSHDMNYCEGNIVKYITRYKHKGTPLQDLKKGREYFDRLIREQEELLALAEEGKAMEGKW